MGQGGQGGLRLRYDLLIDGGKVVTPEAVFAANIAVREGRIVAFLDPGEKPDAKRIIDAGNHHVLPGAIDVHAHFRDPALPEREDFISGSSAAAAGGVTTIIEMPTSDPPVNSADTLRHRMERVAGKSLVDYAFYGGAGHENLAEIPKMAAAGAVGFKTFLSKPMPKGQQIYRFNGLWCTEATLYEVMQAVADTGRVHSIHCEHVAMVDHFERKMKEAGRTDGLAWGLSRPPMAENAATAVVLAVAVEVQGKTHIAHVSTPYSASMVANARAHGVDVTAETCPQYLFLDETALRDYGSWAKCNPPVRSPMSVAQLWERVREGDVDILATDHSPHPAGEREQDIFAAPSGVPCLDLVMPLMLDAVNRDQLSLSRLAALTAEAPARRFGLDRKGKIALGYDADLVVVDLDARWAFDWRRAFTKSRERMQVYHQRSLKGRVLRSLVRGHEVYRECEIVAEPGWGRLLTSI